MTATADRLLIDPGTLTTVVRRALGTETAEVADWQVTRLTAGLSGAGVYRVTGQATVAGDIMPWDVVLKTLQRNPEHDDPGDWNYWKREALLYTSGFLDDLPAGLRAARCFLVDERGPAAAWLWLEALPEPPAGRLSAADYADRARRLGLFNGAYLSQRAIPSAPWLPSDWLHMHLEWSEPRINRLRVCGEHPVVRRIWPPFLLDDIERLWDERMILLEARDRLPELFCHGDTTSRNLFLLSNKDGEEEMVGIDWAFAQRGPVGADAASLLVGALVFLEVRPAEIATLDRVVFTAYLGGLRAAGWDGDERLVRLGYTASVALRDGLCFVGDAFDAVFASTEESSEAICQAFYGRSAAEAFADHPQLIAYALQLGEEARRLVQVVADMEGRS